MNTMAFRNSLQDKVEPSYGFFTSHLNKKQMKGFLSSYKGSSGMPPQLDDFDNGTVLTNFLL